MRKTRWVLAVVVWLGWQPAGSAQDGRVEAGATGERCLAAALDTARWLSSVSRPTALAEPAKNGRTWPPVVEQTGGAARAPTDLSLYSGSPGIVLFLLELATTAGVTQSEEWLRHARQGADELLAELERRVRAGDALDCGLYTGLAGLGFTFCETWKRTGDEKYRDAATRCLELVVDRAEEAETGAHWGESTDVISGAAGIGLFLLYAARELDRPDAVRLACRAGDHLIALAIPVESDGSVEPGAPGKRRVKWAMSASYERRMPNFSHGTAGVGHFLVELYEASGVERYLENARAAAQYLAAIAAPRDDGALVFHHEPGGEDLFYLSWCHGPPGTVRFLLALERASGDEAPAVLARELVAGLSSSGLPERCEGFWNNVGVCCGNAGVIDVFLALDSLDAVASGEHDALTERLVADLLERATRDEHGTRWTHAEHRVRPELLTTQTGYMQGAAGIGMVLLRAHARATGTTTRIRLPDEPWGRLEARR